MSDTKWTPGPWLVATSNSWRRIVNARGNPVCIPIIQHSDNHPDMEFPNGGPEGPDAHLIAAAPELYEALDNLLKIQPRPPITESEKWQVRLAKAALRKARGES